MIQMKYRENIILIIKAVIAHVVTYMLCGAIAQAAFNYQDHIENLGMISMDAVNSPAFMRNLILAQIARGILFGIVILWIKDSVVGKKLAWLKLWAILVILGIISVYAPAPGSIEGFLYLAPAVAPANEPQSLAFELGSAAEVFLQPLLFSIIVTFQRKKREVR